MPRPAIETIALTKIYEQRTVLDSVNLSIPSQSYFSLIGPKGAGKTTFLRILLGLVKPNAGSANVMGFDCSLDYQNVRERCGVLFQENDLYSQLSALDNLLFKGLETSKRKARGSHSRAASTYRPLGKPPRIHSGLGSGNVQKTCPGQGASA
jgi:ABC-type multidrug transport system ATPase subunit